MYIRIIPLIVSICLVGYEVFERMAYHGISSNLVIYLTTELHEGTVKSANNVTNWIGTVWMTPILGAYIADAHLGRYWTFIIALGIYLLVISVLISIFFYFYLLLILYNILFPIIPNKLDHDFSLFQT